MDKSNLGLSVRLHRKANGLSRESLAKLADVKKDTVLEVERGSQSVKLEKVIKILAALNIEIALKSPIITMLDKQETKYGLQ
jgi:HTH-type transcriptional regulator/antitoxin HipB